VAAFAATGEIDIGLEMSFLPKLLAEHNRFATIAAVRAAQRAADQLSGEPRDRFNAWIRQVFGPTASELGWLLHPRDDLDAERSREVVVSLVAESGDESLRAAAVALARNWRALPSANRAHILGVAADADPATFDRLLAAAPVETNPELRGDLLNAITDVRDEVRLRSALALDPRIEQRRRRQSRHPASISAANSRWPTTARSSGPGSGARCLLPFGDDKAERVVDSVGGAEMRPEVGLDRDDLAHAAVGMVAASRPTTKPRLADLGHLLERCGAGLIRLLHEEGATDSMYVATR
jgi:hypothetical protein